MKILVSAIACDPYGHSELYVGWSAVQCLARDHELWVLTSGRARANIERAATEGLVPANVRFIYPGRFQEWHSNRLRARLQSWSEYRSFTKAILPVAQQLHRAVNFDLAHHVTYATWRVGSPLWKLGIPFVFGPIGGNVRFPIRFLPMLSVSAAAFELLRSFSNTVSGFSPSVRACIRHAAHVFTVDPQTEALVTRLRGSTAGVSWLLHAFFSDAKLKAFAQFAHLRNLEGPLRLFAGGNLIGAKGVALALHALAQVKAKGVMFLYRLGGGGPEARHLRTLADRLGLQGEVVFGESLIGEAYQKELGATHIFLLPSLRESAGLTMMEAMQAGCVPIVADCGGPARIVTETCGYKIPVSNRERMVHELANTILTLDRHREIILEKGAAARERITIGFAEEHHRKAANGIYLSVTQR